MKTETEYLRGELLQARDLLAQAVGVLNAAACGIAPEFAKLSTVVKLKDDIAEFQTHGIAVLPAGVKADV